MGGRTPLSTLPNGSPSPNKTVTCAKAALGKPTPQKRATPAKGRKRGPRPAQPAQTQHVKTPPPGGPVVAAPAASTQVCHGTCVHKNTVLQSSCDPDWARIAFPSMRQLPAVAVPTLWHSAPLHTAGCGHPKAGPQQRQQTAAPQNPRWRRPEPRRRHQGRPIGRSPIVYPSSTNKGMKLAFQAPTCCLPKFDKQRLEAGLSGTHMLSTQVRQTKA